MYLKGIVTEIQSGNGDTEMKDKGEVEFLPVLIYSRKL
jgi:hypothetical protein